jgi:hypothetical protein
MNVQLQPNFRTAERRLPFECVALVLQGGGALGAYQAGRADRMLRQLRRQQKILRGTRSRLTKSRPGNRPGVCRGRLVKELLAPRGSTAAGPIIDGRQ